MKYLILFCLLSCINLQAQSVNSENIRTGLSQEELAIAKEKFIQMMKTDTYISYKKNVRNISKKMKTLKTPYYKEVGLCHADQVRDWLSKNLAKTDFKSAEEGAAMYQKSCELLEKLQKDNAELYALMTKASSKQFREIREPEITAMRESMFAN